MDKFNPTTRVRTYCNHCRKGVYKHEVLLAIATRAGFTFVRDTVCERCFCTTENGFLPREASDSFLIPETIVPVRSSEATEHWQIVAEGVNPPEVDLPPFLKDRNI